MKLAVSRILASTVLALAIGGSVCAQGLPGTAPEAAIDAAPVGVPGPSLAVGPAGVTGGPIAGPDAGSPNDFPTEARAEYVFACMATNGRTADMLRRCSCSVDVIASIMPYDTYVEAETVLAMMQTSGERVEVMRTAPPAKAFVQGLRRAQAESSVRCF